MSWASPLAQTPIPWDWELWLMVPLVFVVAAVYKTVRVKTLRRLPVAAAYAFARTLAVVVLLGVILWGISHFLWSQ